MTIVRGAGGLAAVVTAMLLQATVVGPLVYPVPVSLPLLVVVAVALLCGPSTGIALGFGAGLLADLTANHPVGLLALTWLGAGVVAGIVGGVVTPPAPRSGARSSSARSELSRPGARSDRAPGSRRAARTRRRAIERARAGSLAPDQWRAQAVLVGLIATAATATGLTLIAAVAGQTDALPAQLIQLIPTVLLDAMCAVAVLALARTMLASAALRPVAPVGRGPGSGPGPGFSSRTGAVMAGSGRPVEFG